MDQKVEFLFLSQEEMIEAGVLDMRNCVDVMDRAFKLLGRGDCLMGGPSGNHHGMKIYFPKEPRGPRMPVDGPDRRFMALVSYLGGDFHVCGAKWYGSNIENSTRGLPRSILLVIINDPETAAPLAIMDGNLISAMRTGAVIGLGAKYLVKKEAEVAGIIAAGVISKTCLMALAVGMPNLKEVKVFDINREKAEAFAREMGEKLGIKIVAVDSMETAIRESDAVSSATSRVKIPHFEPQWFKPGAFLGLSSDAHLTEDFWLGAKVVADNWKMHIDWREETSRIPEEIRKPPLYGNLHQLILDGRMKDDDVLEMAQIVAGAVVVRENEKQRIVYITGGMGIEDTAWGFTVYEKARKKGLGKKLKLWDRPYWY
ncbi:MAG: ornithine cyclodeaminase [Deltaproteobacteria bacterium]|nr:ornithine cyclodeaminase [Deltaproteobacteria bacterium]MBW1961851.1 ornithine cyclodeaminase [Deltaproteobacteria bacterium]MBW2153256.1 ornithine cyclodeaminase [Deltaproteobacteria bacterium]